MIKGMTGFGTTLLSRGAIKGIIEIKSLNHRYLDLNFYLPTGLASMEDKIRRLIAKEIKRGRITIAIKITTKPSQQITFQENTIKRYIQYTRTLKRKYHLSGGLTVADLITLPGVVEAKETFLSADAMWPAVSRAMQTSLRALVAMRKREGISLAVDIKGQLRRMSAQARKIRARAKRLLREKKNVLGSDEFSAFQKGSDVNEELSRLEHYVAEAKALLKATEPVGKKIDFVAQEMQRETNTVGSKLQDKVVSSAVIALKSKIEKIREQSQNIE